MKKYLISFAFLLAALCSCSKGDDNVGSGGNEGGGDGTDPKNPVVSISFTSGSDIIADSDLPSIAGALNLLLIDSTSTLAQHELYSSLGEHSSIELAKGGWDMYYLTNVSKESVKGDIAVGGSCKDLYVELEKSSGSETYTAPNYMFYGKTSVSVNDAATSASVAISPIVAAITVVVDGVSSSDMFVESAKITNCCTNFSLINNVCGGVVGDVELSVSSTDSDKFTLEGFALPTFAGEESELVLNIKNMNGKVSTITRSFENGIEAGKVYEIEAAFEQGWTFTTVEKEWDECLETLQAYNPQISVTPNFVSGVESLTDAQVASMATGVNFFALDKSYMINYKAVFPTISSSTTHVIAEGEYQLLYASNLNNITLSGDTTLNAKCSNLYLEHQVNGDGVYNSLDTILYSNQKHTIGITSSTPTVTLVPATGRVNVTISKEGSSESKVNSVTLLNSSSKFSLTNGSAESSSVDVALDLQMNNDGSGSATGNAFATVSNTVCAIVINYTNNGVTEDARVDLSETLSAGSTLNIEASYSTGVRWEVVATKDNWGVTVDEELQAYDPADDYDYVGATTLIINSGDSGVSLSSADFSTINFNAFTSTGIDCSVKGDVSLTQGSVVTDNGSKLEVDLSFAPIALARTYSGKLTISNFGYSSEIWDPTFKYFNSALKAVWSIESDGTRTLEITLEPQTVVNSSDAAALLELREALVSYQGLSNLEEWGWDGDDVSKWKNITIHSDGRVVGIGSNSYEAREYLPVQIIIATVKSTAISGFTYPESFGDLSRLCYINFDFLPSTYTSTNLPDMSKMKNLQVAVTPPTTATSVGVLPDSLRDLQIIGENITSFTNMPTSLESFSFYGNKGGSFTAAQLWDMFPSQMEELIIGGAIAAINPQHQVALKKLQIYDATASLEAEYLSNLAASSQSSLKQLVVSEVTGFADQQMAHIQLLKNLTSLTLESTSITSIPVALDMLTKLETIVISNNSSLKGSLSPSLAYSYLMGGVNVTVYNQSQFSQTGFYITIDGTSYPTYVELSGHKVHTKKIVLTAPSTLSWYAEVDYSSYNNVVELSSTSGRGSTTLTLTVDSSDKYQYDYGPVNFYTADGNKTLLASFKIIIH